MRRVRENPYAAVVALAAVAFIALSAWWVLADQRLPGGGDPGRHLSTALGYGDRLADLDPAAIFDYRGDASSGFFYPPLARFVAGIPAAFDLAVQDWGVILTNVVFVPMLAAGCYLVGARVYNRFAGVLAAIFALGTPMVLDLFHVFMLDAQQAAVVALTLWALLACERFERRRQAVLAGALVGVAVMVKSTAAVFFVGPVAVMLIGGGWRRWPNVGLAAAAGLAIALPWHLAHAGDVTNLSGQAPGGLAPGGFGGGEVGVTTDIFDRLTDYGWVAVNLQYFVPLLLLFAVGLVYAIREVRTRPHMPELLAGIAFSYLFFAFAIELRDPRYTLSLVVFVAVIATGWIATTRHAAIRGAALGLLFAAVAINVTATVTDALPTTRVSPPGDDYNVGYRAQPGTLTFLDDVGYIGGPPRRDPFWTQLMDAAEAEGITTAEIRIREAPSLGADHLGFLVLAEQRGISETTFVEGAGRPDLLVDVWFTGDEYWVEEEGLPRPCGTVPDGIAVPEGDRPVSLRVAVQRRADGRYERWCEFVATPDA